MNRYRFFGGLGLMGMAVVVGDLSGDINDTVKVADMIYVVGSAVVMLSFSD